MPYKRYNKKRPFYKKRRTAKRVSKSVKKYVKSAIRRSSENKIVNWRYSGLLSAFNAPFSYWLTSNFFELTPNSISLSIPQGTGQGNRISNSINTRKVMLKYILWPTQYDGILNPFPRPVDIRVVIGSYKPDLVDGPLYTSFNNYFQQGNSSTGPLGNLLDMVSDINKNQFQIYSDKVVKLGYSAATGLGSVAVTQYFANNDYKMNIIRKMNITKYVAKTFGFNDSTNDPSSGRALFIWFMYVNADTTTTNADYKQANIAIDVDFTYDD